MDESSIKVKTKLPCSNHPVEEQSEHRGDVITICQPVTLSESCRIDKLPEREQEGVEPGEMRRRPWNVRRTWKQHGRTLRCIGNGMTKGVNLETGETLSWSSGDARGNNSYKQWSCERGKEARMGSRMGS